jgi:hypothetical protein
MFWRKLKKAHNNNCRAESGPPCSSIPATIASENMSQVSQLLSGQINLGTFIGDVEGDVQGVVKKLETANPAVTTAITSLGTAATTVATDGITWAEGALSGVAGNMATDMEALAQKYLPQVLGTSGANTTAGSVQLASEFGQLLIQLATAAGSLALKAL